MPSTIPITTHQNANLIVLDMSTNIVTAALFSAPDRMPES
jgi:hypothetical protein